MEPITTEFLTGVAFDINATHAGVATNASLAGHPNPQAEGASLPAIDPSTHASVSLPSGSVRMNSAAVSNLCVLASDGPPAYGDLLRPLTCTERQSFAERSPWRTHNERLPPARLVEVAHAALQSSGFRRRPASGAQPPLQNDLQPVQSASIAMAIDAERFGIVKRDVPGDNDGDLVTPHDAKRFRNESYGEATSETTESLKMDVPMDAAAQITTNSGAPSMKREAPTVPPLPIANSISLVSWPHAGRVSGIDGPAVSVADAAPAAVNGLLRSAFSQAACLPTEWEPGCGVTTGRRSARSPAPKGSRSFSLARATSAEAVCVPISRRGSGLGPVLPACNSSENAAGADSCGAAAGSVPCAAVVLEQGAESGSTAGSSGQRGNNIGTAAGLETAASADLRRLAQLAEAAAMLDERTAPRFGYHTAVGTLGSDQDVGPADEVGRSNTADDTSIRGATLSGRLVAEASELAPLRHRAASLTVGGLTTGLGCMAGDELRSATSYPGTGPAMTRHFCALPGSLPESSGVGVGIGRLCGAGGSGWDGNPTAGDAEDLIASRHWSTDSEAGSEGTSEDGNHMGEEDDDVMGEGGDGSNDSAGGGSLAGGGSGRTLTERYRAALKASAKQRGRGHNVIKLDPEKPPRGSNRNGLCARIASITKERLQQVYHLNIEEAARELGIGMTKLKEHCRTLGIPRWPSRKLKSMDKLIESLNERATSEPATKEVIADILSEIESFKRAIYENPCLEVEEDIKRLRQSNFKKEYQQRQVEQRLRGGPLEKISGSAISSCNGGGMARSSSILGAQLLQGGGDSSPLPTPTLPAAGSIMSGTSLQHILLSQPMLPAAALTSNMGPALGPLAAGTVAAQNSAQLVHALAQAQALHLPGQMSMLAPGQLQQFFMAQPPAVLQQLIAQQALGAIQSPGVLLPPMLQDQLQQSQQLPRAVGLLSAMGEALPNAE